MSKPMKTTHPRFAGLLIATCSLIAASALADTKLISNGSPARVLVPTDGSLGGTWRGVSFNDSSWIHGSNGVGYEVNPGAFNASVIADSQGEWSTSGRQGENSWINGYYDFASDPDTTYQATDFQPFPRSDGPYGSDNFWNGGSWDWFNGDPPWDTIGATDVHPNGVNQPQGEHWVIRRWVSTTSGAITLRFHVRKSNLNGTGVTGKIFKNGAEIFTRAINGNDGTGFQAYVNTTAAAGDIFDFALTPVGPGGDPGDGADGSIMTATVLSGTVSPPPPPPQSATVADSVADWSNTGLQGANGWYYGVYNKTADADGAYNPNTDFNTTDPNWTFGGGAWTLGPGDPPWDIIAQTEWHPNGDNNAHVDWVIRRWVSDVDGDMYTHVKFGKQNINGGNGTTLHVLHNGTELFSQTVAFNNSAGIDVNIPIPGVFSGDKIEFALDPLGTDGGYGDGADGSYLMATISTGPAPQTEVANSETDWSATGVQGANGWFYGFYNQTADANGTYNPSSDFNTTDPQWTFSGAWTLGPGDPPWDTIEQVNWHPNGDNQPQGVHWVIRRWVSDVDGDLHTRVRFGKQNINGGNGTTLRVLHNGTQVASYTVAFNNGTGIDTNVNLPNVLIGDRIEFALDPTGTDGGKGDGADGSFLRASILTGLAPEPPRPFVPGVADCFLTDVESVMKGVNPSVYIRLPFNVANPAAIQTLKLKLKYNDGFAAYLNGKEVAKRNAPTTIAGITVADSIANWSTNPDVTVNGWSYGYYDQSLDADGTYSGGSDFRPFPHDGGGASPTDFWVGNGYDWFQGNPPWTELFQEGTHPNHPNGSAVDPNNPATHLHWTVRRWNATVDANLKCRVRFRKTNANCGDGVRVSVFHNSVQVYSQTIAFNDSIGRDDTFDLPDVFLGDNIDLLLGPGDGNDFCDGSAFSMVLFEGEPTIPWNGAATASRTTTETISPSVFDISSFISELTPGANMLAIQGFNAAVNDNEFVINAEVLANQVPTAVNDTVPGKIDTTTTYPGSVLLGNDIDPDGDHLLLVGVTPTYVTAQGGSVRLYGDTVRYTPPLGFSGTDTFQYTATDLSGTPSRATVSVTVTANQPPVAGDDSVVTHSGTPVTFNVLANDSDPDGDTLRVDSVSGGPSHGTVAVNLQTGAATYTPNPGYAGPDSFTYTVTDGKGGTDTAVVAISVVNRAPVAANDAVSTPEGTPVSFNVLANDSDPDGDPLRVTASTSPAHGTASVQPTGQALYTPAPGYTGPDAFSYSITDGNGGTASATVTITVRPSNLPPTGCAAGIVPEQCALRSADGSLLVVSVNGENACVTLHGSATDPEGQPLNYSWWTNGAVFAVGGTATNCFELGCHTVTFVALDSAEASCTTTLNICVVAPSEAVELCIDLVEQTNVDRKNKRPLIASLKAAAAAFDRGSAGAGFNQLRAFQNKVRAQIGNSNPAAAQAFINCAQQLIDAVGCSMLTSGEQP